MHRMPDEIAEALSTFGKAFTTAYVEGFKALAAALVTVRIEGPAVKEDADIVKVGEQFAREWERRHGLAPEPAEQSVPVDWQAIVKQRDRELKTVGERKYVAEQELAKMRDAYKAALARMAKVCEVHDIQGEPGNWDVDEYQRGYYNGLELAVSILDGDRDPVFRDAPASGYRTPKRASDPDPPTVNIIG